MKATITRNIFTEKSTIGMLDLDGVFQNYTLEPPKRTEKPCCIPAGTYQVKMQWSNHFQRVLPCLQNVPDFTAVEWHNGNYPTDTDACTLMGKTRAKDFIGISNTALDELLPKLPMEFEVTYIEVEETI